MMLLTRVILRAYPPAASCPSPLVDFPSRVVRPCSRLEAAEGIDGRLEDIVRIVGASVLSGVLHPGRLEQGERPTRDDPGACEAGAQEDARAAPK